MEPLKNNRRLGSGLSTPLRYSLPLGDQTQEQGVAKERDDVICAKKWGEYVVINSIPARRVPCLKKHDRKKIIHAVWGDPEFQMVQQ